jgi:phosphohistidine phosphatase
MKTLLFMRHAKSSWKEKGITDQERPINKRGRRDAPLMGHLLIDRELVPQRIISSSAVRARQTAEIVEVSSTERLVSWRRWISRNACIWPKHQSITRCLRALPDDLERVMMIGHNPGMETVLQLLSNRIESLPTAVVAHISSYRSTSWSELEL